MKGPFLSFDDVRCIVETPNAILCLVHGNEVWIPQSQIHDDSEVYEKESHGRLIVSEWIARNKSIEKLGDAYEDDD